MKYIYIIILLLLTTCIPVNHILFIDYVVPKGMHYSIPRADIGIPSSVVTFEFKTNATWIWDEPEPSGYSKVAGLSFPTPHLTSSRVVFDGKKLGTYFYIDGVSPMENGEQWCKLWDVEIPATYTATCGYRDGYAYIHIYNNNNINQDTVIEYKCPKPSCLASFAAPYVGGRYVIDHDWRVPIRLK